MSDAKLLLHHCEDLASSSVTSVTVDADFDLVTKMNEKREYFIGACRCELFIAWSVNKSSHE